jgi:hypothetical protein
MFQHCQWMFQYYRCNAAVKVAKSVARKRGWWCCEGIRKKTIIYLTSQKEISIAFPLLWHFYIVYSVHYDAVTNHVDPNTNNGTTL